jgi:hypothetical protein
MRISGLQAAQILEKMNRQRCVCDLPGFLLKNFIKFSYEARGSETKYHTGLFSCFLDLKKFTKEVETLVNIPISGNCHWEIEWTRTIRVTQLNTAESWSGRNKSFPA